MMVYEPFFVIHLILYSLNINVIQTKAYINLYINIFFVITTVIYFKYGISNMENFKMPKNKNQFKVGVQKIKSNSGNYCVVFYPTDSKEKESPISPFLDAEKSIKSLKMAGRVPFGQSEVIKSRKVAKTCCDAPLE